MKTKQIKTSKQKYELSIFVPQQLLYKKDRQINKQKINSSNEQRLSDSMKQQQTQNHSQIPHAIINRKKNKQSYKTK